ncbi:MAG: M28 family peptidase, partial [Chthoniobacteraceae bacterium]
GGPFFSPDGKRIVRRRFDAAGKNADVFTMKTDGSDVRQVTDFKSMSWAPYYHPSGDYLIFTSNKLGFDNFELFMVDAAGTKEPVRVTFTDGFDGLPVFSPDGTQLCWTSNRGSGESSQLWLAKWNDTAARHALDQSPTRGAVPSTPSVSSPAKSHSEETSPVTQTDPLANLAPTISSSDIKAEVSWLASPERGGRMTGSEGGRLASEEIASYLKAVGVEPIGNSFFLPFEFNAGERILPTGNTLMVTGLDPAREFKVNEDFRPLAFTENATVEGEVVFAGYGLSVPEGGGDRYNSYDGLDVTDKMVLILRYVPEGVDAKRRAQLNRYAGLRYKAMLARERGAKAVLFVTGPNSPQAGELLPLSSDNVMSGSGIVTASITGEVADLLLESANKTLKALQTGLDQENPHAEASVEVPKVKVEIATAVEHVKKSDRNVVGVLPPNGSDEYVLLGAHYDHLGTGTMGSSMAHSGEEGQVHPGADDNGSGTALVMELAASLVKERAANPAKFKRGVIFGFWSGEELGLIGSAAFAEHPPVPLEKIKAYLNFDMVGRLRENRLTIQGVGSSNLWPRLLEKRNIAAGFTLALQNDPYLPTDTTSFYPKRIPVLNFFTGAHEDYHRPTDTADKVDYEGVERIAKFAQAITLDLVASDDPPEFAHVKRSDSPSGSRDSLRAYLGTIPDYTIEVKGVKLSGVRGGSPAEKGGIKGGDIILEFAGQKITNIYDYTYALDAVKIDQPVEVVVDRNGRSVKLKVTPEARK